MNAQQREKFDAATDRFAIASRATPDVAQATALWTQGLAADLSDEDLRKIVEFSRTPAGRQAMASSLNAAMQLHAYLEQTEQRHARQGDSAVPRRDQGHQRRFGRSLKGARTSVIAPRRSA